MKIISIHFLILLILHFNAADSKRVKRIVGGRMAAAPPPDDPVVFSQMYGRDARVEGFRNKENGIYNFLGIRYADPPTGMDRFLRPRYRRLSGDLMATKYGPPCPQPDPYNPNRIIGNEDCLMLNIYTPQMPDETTGLPVYIWIHPGGFRYGSANQYDAQPIAQQGVIFVPIQYRLGTLGIIGDGSKEFSGNLAMFDMTVALRWVTEYISFFGGNPKQIKIIGHGSGAASAMYMGMSRVPRSGSINGIVSMSGSALSQYATDTEPVQSVAEIAMLNECPTTNELEIVNCLRNRSVDDIIKTDSMVQTERLQGRAMIAGIAGRAGFNPHIEEIDDNRGLPGFITRKPDEILKDGKQSKIPLLIGVTKHETGNSLTVNTITTIWGSAEKFLNSLFGTISNSLKSFMKIDQATGALLKPVLPGLGQLGINLNDFLKVPDPSNIVEVLNKITETTTDVLFNLPAVLSAEIWGKIAPSYLYSFEFHGSQTSKGINFLRGLPIVSASPGTAASSMANNFTAHGDELGYLFEANDLFGKPIAEAKLKDPKDLKARENFIGLLKQFANMDVNSNPNSDSLFQRFSGKGTPYIKVTDTLEFSDNFRFCELSLWGAPLQAIQSTSCDGLMKGLDAVIGTVNKITKPLTGNLGNPLGSIIPGGDKGTSKQKGLAGSLFG